MRPICCKLPNSGVPKRSSFPQSEGRPLGDATVGELGSLICRVSMEERGQFYTEFLELALQAPIYSLLPFLVCSQF